MKNPDLDFGKLLLAVIAQVGPVTITKEAFLQPTYEGKPVGSIKMRLEVNQNAITLVPIGEEETKTMLIEGMLANILADLPTSGGGH